MRFIRDLRLIPIALIASACLLVLKIADLALSAGRFTRGDASISDNGATLIRTSPDGPPPSGQDRSWAQQMFNFPDGGNADTAPDIAPRGARLTMGAPDPGADITGSIAAEPTGATGATGKPAPGAPDAKPPKDGKPATAPEGIAIPTDAAGRPSGAERAILQRLQQRREELDARARELDIRESLLKAAEQRIDARLAEIKEVEARIATETEQKDTAEAARFKGLVTMYENMKPRDAAKIFDRLDVDVLIKVVSQINPRTMSEIMAQMSPEMAQRLTVELANKAQRTAKNDPAALPKIEGKPVAQ